MSEEKYTPFLQIQSTLQIIYYSRSSSDVINQIIPKTSGCPNPQRSHRRQPQQQQTPPHRTEHTFLCCACTHARTSARTHVHTTTHTPNSMLRSKNTLLCVCSVNIPFRHPTPSMCVYCDSHRGFLPVCVHFMLF